MTEIPDHLLKRAQKARENAVALEREPAQVIPIFTRTVVSDTQFWGNERNACDAPVWYRSEEASAWAAGYNEAVEQLKKQYNAAMDELKKQLGL